MYISTGPHGAAPHLIFPFILIIIECPLIIIIIPLFLLLLIIGQGHKLVPQEGPAGGRTPPRPTPTMTDPSSLVSGPKGRST